MTAINTRFSGQARHSVKTALVAGWLFMYTMPHHLDISTSARVRNHLDHESNSSSAPWTVPLLTTPERMRVSECVCVCARE